MRLNLLIFLLVPFTTSLFGQIPIRQLKVDTQLILQIQTAIDVQRISIQLIAGDRFLRLADSTFWLGAGYINLPDSLVDTVTSFKKLPINRSTGRNLAHGVYTIHQVLGDTIPEFESGELDQDWFVIRNEKLLTEVVPGDYIRALLPDTTTIVESIPEVESEPETTETDQKVKGMSLYWLSFIIGAISGFLIGFLTRTILIKKLVGTAPEVERSNPPKSTLPNQQNASPLKESSENVVVDPDAGSERVRKAGEKGAWLRLYDPGIDDLFRETEILHAFFAEKCQQFSTLATQESGELFDKMKQQYDREISVEGEDKLRQLMSTYTSDNGRVDDERITDKIGRISDETHQQSVFLQSLFRLGLREKLNAGLRLLGELVVFSNFTDQPGETSLEIEELQKLAGQRLRRLLEVCRYAKLDVQYVGLLEPMDALVKLRTRRLPDEAVMPNYYDKLRADLEKMEDIKERRVLFVGKFAFYPSEETGIILA